MYTHCVWAAPALFADTTDRSIFLRELARTTAKVEWTCLAYCLLNTHYHLIVEVEDNVLARGMHALNFRYAVSFNQRHEMRGHVQAARYGSRRLGGVDELNYAFRYVARNPVKAGLCGSPCDWEWSSYRAAVGLADPISFVNPRIVVAGFGEVREFATRALRDYVENA